MRTIDKIITFVDFNLIYCLPAIVLTLIVFRLIFRNKTGTEKALNFVSWTIIVYTIASILYLIAKVFLDSDGPQFLPRLHGPYWVAFWIMFTCGLIIPLTLLVKRFRKNFLYVFVVAITMKIGSYYEIFVIWITSYYRDHVPGTGVGDLTIPIGFLMILFQGIILGVLLLGFVDLKSIRRRVKS